MDATIFPNYLLVYQQVCNKILVYQRSYCCDSAKDMQQYILKPNSAFRPMQTISIEDGENFIYASRDKTVTLPIWDEKIIKVVH